MYNGACHQWLIYGLSSSRTFPTICVHICSVSHVSFHASYGNAGHSSVAFSLAILFLMSMFLSIGLSIVFPLLLRSVAFFLFAAFGRREEGEKRGHLALRQSAAPSALPLSPTIQPFCVSVYY